MQCDDIKEGFWCPICKHNCYSSTQLYVHFSTVHCKVSKDVPISQIKDCAVLMQTCSIVPNN
ncbi:hypothetical protein D917_08499, partial [Trichinella nativa]